MVFFTGEQRERAHRFDAFREAANTALSDELVAELLGPVALDLANINRESFLPNVRFGRVSLPRKYRETNQLPVLPKLPTDGTLKPALSLLMPTPSTMAHANATLYARDGADATPFSRREVRSALRRTFKKLDSKERTRPVNWPVPQVYEEDTTARGIPVIGRPVLALPPNEINRQPLAQQTTALHELMHAKDFLQALPGLEVQKNPYTQPWLEVRGYTAGGAAMVAAWENDAIDINFIQRHLGITAAVVNETRRLSLEPDDILSDTFECNQQNSALQQMALFLTIEGIIDLPGAD